MAADDGWAFATYRNYLAAYARLLEPFGTAALRFQAIRDAVQRCAAARVAPLDPSKPRDEIARSLRNAWATEVAMALPRAFDYGDVRFIAASLHWLGPQAYYATYQAGLATILAKGAPLPGSHQQFLKAMASQFIEKVMLPAPWDAACGRGTVNAAGHAYSGCLTGGSPAANTLYPMDAADAIRVLCLGLKTTRDRRFEDLKSALIKSRQVRTKAGKPAKHIALSRQNTEYEEMSPTTTFDFLYRLRIRSNYRDADTFLAQNLGDVAAFYEELVDLTRCTLHALETLAALALGEKWLGNAVDAFARRRLPSFATQFSVVARWPQFVSSA